MATPTKKAKKPEGKPKASFLGYLKETPTAVTPEEQKKTVNYLKDAGVLPPTEDPKDYPILTAALKREVIATLLQQKETELANHVARWPSEKVRAAKLRQFKVGDEVKYDAKWLRNTGQMTGETPRVKGKVVKLTRMGGDVWPVVQFPRAYDPEPRLVHPNNLRLAKQPEVVD